AGRADALHPHAAGRGDGAARRGPLPHHRRGGRRARSGVARGGPPPEARARAHRRPARPRAGRDADRRAGDEPLRPCGVARPRRLERYRRLSQEYEDAAELLAMDGDMAAEIEDSIAPLRRELEQLQEDALFSGEYDSGDAVVTIQADAGGTDAQDFTEMVLRMYLRWAERRGFKTQLLEASPGEEAGLKSATFTVEGDNAYGVLKAERGKHRLVRLSPFDQADRRHTSFAQVIPAPLLAEDGQVDVDENDLRIDTYRASGAGGQHVNKTDSAVRITHLPTGIVVSVQNERSQSSNKQTALRILR